MPEAFQKSYIDYLNIQKLKKKQNLPIDNATFCFYNCDINAKGGRYIERTKKHKNINFERKIKKKILKN